MEARSSVLEESSHEYTQYSTASMWHGLALFSSRDRENCHESSVFAGPDCGEVY